MIKTVKASPVPSRSCISFDQNPFLITKELIELHSSKHPSLPWAPLSHFLSKLKEKQEIIGKPSFHHKRKF